MKKETKTIAQISATPKVANANANAPERVVGKVDLSRLYENKLSTNIKDLDKDFAKSLKTQVAELMQSIADKNKHSKHINVIINADEKLSIKTAIAKALEVDADKISNSMLEKAIVSGMTNRFVRSDTRGTKVEGWAYSVSTFLKSINASVFKKVEK